MSIYVRERYKSFLRCFCKIDFSFSKKKLLLYKLRDLYYINKQKSFNCFSSFIIT